MDRVKAKFKVPHISKADLPFLVSVFVISFLAAAPILGLILR